MARDSDLVVGNEAASIRDCAHGPTYAPGMVDLTALLAWIGALSGVGALVWQMLTWRRSGHNVKVLRTQSWFTLSDGSLSDAMVCVTARNVGTSAVTLTGWGIQLGGRTADNMTVLRPLPRTTELPHRLEPGTEAGFWVAARHLVEASAERRVPLDQMRCWIGLATGRKVYAKRRGVPVSTS